MKVIFKRSDGTAERVVDVAPSSKLGENREAAQMILGLPESGSYKLVLRRTNQTLEDRLNFIEAGVQANDELILSPASLNTEDEVKSSSESISDSKTRSHHNSETSQSSSSIPNTNQSIDSLSRKGLLSDWKKTAIVGGLTGFVLLRGILSLTSSNTSTLSTGAASSTYNENEEALIIDELEEAGSEYVETRFDNEFFPKKNCSSEQSDIGTLLYPVLAEYSNYNFEKLTQEYCSNATTNQEGNITVASFTSREEAKEFSIFIQNEFGKSWVDRPKRVRVKTQFDNYDFPKKACGDPEPTDFTLLFPVFTAYSTSNLADIRNLYCEDAYQNGDRIQVASFTSRDKAEEFSIFLKGRLGSGLIGDRASIKGFHKESFLTLVSTDSPVSTPESFQIPQTDPTCSIAEFSDNFKYNFEWNFNNSTYRGHLTMSGNSGVLVLLERGPYTPLQQTMQLYQCSSYLLLDGGDDPRDLSTNEIEQDYNPDNFYFYVVQSSEGKKLKAINNDDKNNRVDLSFQQSKTQ